MRKGFKLVLVGGVVALAAWLFPILQPLVKYGTIPKNLSSPMNILLMGVAPEYRYYHQRAKEDFRGLSDVNLLVRLDPISRRMTILSIPRDTYVDIPEYGRYIINHANKFGGPALSKQVVANLTNVPVHGYVAVSVEFIRQAVDALGGVEVCVDKPMQYTDTAAKLKIDLQPGCQRMNGAVAEGYVRFRHDALGDIGRIQRQQKFFQALKKQLFTPQGAVAIPNALAVTSDNLKTDLTKDQIGQILGFALLRPSMSSVLAPGTFGQGWEIDQPALQQVVNTYFKNTPAKVNLSPKTLEGMYVAVYYARAQESTAMKVRSTLEGAGLRVNLKEVETAPTHSEVLSNTDEVKAGVLAKLLGLTGRMSGEADPWIDLTLRIGPDFPQP